MGQIDLEPDADDFFARLSKERTLLSLEKSTRGPRSHLWEIIWWCWGKHGHKVVACGRCWVFTGLAIV